MHVEVKLDPHIGRQETPFGVVDVEHDQYLVMAQADDYTWKHVGYICKPSANNPSLPFNGLDNFRVLPQILKDTIVSRVSDLLGRADVRVTEIPEPVEVEEYIDDDADA